MSDVEQDRVVETLMPTFLRKCKTLGEDQAVEWAMMLLTRFMASGAVDGLTIELIIRKLKVDSRRQLDANL